VKSKPLGISYRKRWYKDANLKIAPHRARPTPWLKEYWAECLASGKGPPLVTDEIDRGPNDRRITSIG
jgi:hypothetical protein